MDSAKIPSISSLSLSLSLSLCLSLSLSLSVSLCLSILSLCLSLLGQIYWCFCLLCYDEWINQKLFYLVWETMYCIFRYLKAIFMQFYMYCVIYALYIFILSYLMHFFHPFMTFMINVEGLLCNILLHLSYSLTMSLLHLDLIFIFK